MSQTSLTQGDIRRCFSSQIIDECNTEVGKMRQMEELILISKTLEFDKLKVDSNTHPLHMCVVLSVSVLAGRLITGHLF